MAANVGKKPGVPPAAPASPAPASPAAPAPAKPTPPTTPGTDAGKKPGESPAQAPAAPAKPAPPMASAADIRKKLIENKPGEPEFQMKIVDNENSVLAFRAPPSGFPPASNPVDQKDAITLDLKVMNTTKHRQTFKVKCTDNDIFRVRPPLGFIKPDETFTIKVSFFATTKTAAENNKHFFAIYHFKTEDTNNVRQIWTPNVKPEGVKRIAAAFENPDGTLIGAGPAACGPAAPEQPNAAAAATEKPKENAPEKK
uniref:Major sperm protein n=1 Tax=Panagrolaimus sp. PS1159 TaxID=55785 RepID=A0AC35GG28_9BILA